jgi:hypothetical protein
MDHTRRTLPRMTACSERTHARRRPIDETSRRSLQSLNRIRRLANSGDVVNTRPGRPSEEAATHGSRQIAEHRRGYEVAQCSLLFDATRSSILGCLARRRPVGRESRDLCWAGNGESGRASASRQTCSEELHTRTAPGLPSYVRSEALIDDDAKRREWETTVCGNEILDQT